MSAARILVVDDERSMCELLAASLPPLGYEVHWETEPSAALRAVERADFEAVVTDVRMAAMDGLQLCRQMVERRPDLPVIVVTAFGSLETAIEAIRAGAYDFVVKPFESEVLALALGRAVQHRRLREEVRRLRQAVERPASPDGLVGESSPMRELARLIERIKDADVTVLLEGETGTGKELVARALHLGSRRRDRPFLAINCAALPETLLESELFGHRRGAFTDARQDRLGLFQQADGGVILLDEVGELPLGLQAKLLRVLQERHVRPVGGSEEVPFDVRLVTATNRDLDAEVEAGRFREDLYFRLNVVRVEVPALRHRGNDVLLLAQAFVDEFSTRMGKRVLGFTTATARRLLAYPWPGNVRELRNSIERAVALTEHEQLVVEDLPDRVRDCADPALPSGAGVPQGSERVLPLDEVERVHILRVLDVVGGNKSLAAKMLGLDRKTLYRKLERYGLPAPADP